MRIAISTYFDCTCTGTTGHFRQAQLPSTDQAQQIINNEQDWTRSRNQQRNLETLIQLISLYTQPLNITPTVYDQDTHLWTFEFEVEFAGIIATEDDSLGLLKQQAQNIPMIVGLNESELDDKQLISNSNIFFIELNTATNF